MLVNLFKFYLQGLLTAVLVVFVLDVCWIFYRAAKKMDRTAAQRQAILYEALVIALITIPILSFAFMALMLMMKA